MRLRPGRRWVRPGAIGLVLLAFALRVVLLGEKNLWWDEALAVWAVRKDLAATTLWTAGDVHPPLFFWLLWPWMRLTGQSEFCLRLAVAGLGVLVAVGSFALAGRAAGRRAALVALGLVAVSRFEVWWSMELRMYMPAALAVVAAAYCALRWLGSGRPTGRRLDRWLLGYVAAALAAVHTVYLAAAALVALNVGIAIALGVAGRARGRAETAAVGRWLAAQVGVAAGLLPWLALALPRMQSWSSQGDPPPGLAFVGKLFATLLATGQSVDLTAQAGATGWFLAAVAAAALAGWPAVRRDRGGEVVAGGDRGVAGVALLAPLAAMGVVAVWLAGQPRAWFYSPSVEARYLVPFAAPAYVLAAVALAGAWRRGTVAGGLLVAAAFAPLVLALPGHYRDRRLRDELQSMVLAVWSQAEPGDRVLLSSGDRYPIFLYHYEQPWDVERAGGAYEWSADGRPMVGRPAVTPFPDRSAGPIEGTDWQARLERLAGEGGRLWLAEVEGHLRDPESRVRAWLTERLPLVLSEAYGPNALHLFDPEGQPPAVTAVSGRWPGVRRPDEALPVGWQPVIGLPVGRLMAGDETSVTLWPMPWAYEVGRASWLALEARGGTAAGLVAGPSGTTGMAGRARYVLRVDGRTPSGGYDAVLFSRGQRTRLDGLGVAGGAGPLVPGAPGAAGGASWLQATALWRWPAEPRAALRLDGAAAGGVAPGGSLVVDLYWRWDGPTGGLSVSRQGPVAFVHLLGPARTDGSGTVWAGQDGPASSGDWADRPGRDVFDRRVLRVDAQAPPGEYWLEVGLYDPRSGERLPVRGGGVDEAERRLLLGPVAVGR